MPSDEVTLPISRGRWSAGSSLLLCASWLSIALMITWATLTDATTFVLAIAAGCLLFVACWGRPRFAFVLWISSMAMLPVWVGIDVVATLPLHSMIAVMAAAATLGCSRPKITKFDGYFCLFLFVSLAAVLLSGSSAGSWAEILFRWAIPFFAVRVLVSATGVQFSVNVFAVTAAVVGILSVAELLLRWHPFVNLDTGTFEFEVWHVIQVRNGGDRSEWAFGHSIALGGVLALAIPFIIGSSFRVAARAALLLCAAAGILATASRGALIAATFTMAVCLLYFTKNQLARAISVALSIPTAILLLPAVAPIVETWARGGSDEERGSFDYRGFLYTTFAPKIQLFGLSPVYDGTGTRSIDSTFLHIGLGFGWLVLLMATLPLIACVARVIVGRATIAELAIVGQLPLFATVALITQYESLIFVVVGIAVQTHLEKRDLADDATKTIASYAQLESAK